MNPSELFKDGKLQEAIDAQIQEVKSNPADHARRLFLFELVAFTGDIDRARRQLDVLKFDEVELEMAVGKYRQVLDSEVLRRKLFSDGLPPQFLLDPPASVAQRLQGLHCLREKRLADAAVFLNQANAGADAIQGNLNGKPIIGLRDCDDLFGTVLEVFAQGKYFWVPLEHIDTLALNPPRFPRDLLWLPARIDLTDGGTGEVFLPALYPGTHEHTDMQVKLGRATDWQAADNAPVLGRGLRVFLAGEDALALPEWRQFRQKAGE
jgi:type VI secretion system protein ImpE